MDLPVNSNLMTSGRLFAWDIKGVFCGLMVTESVQFQARLDCYTVLKTSGAGVKPERQSHGLDENGVRLGAWRLLRMSTINGRVVWMASA